MGDWYEDPREPSGWRYDELAPTPGLNPAVTQMLPTVPSPSRRRTFVGADGETYTRIPAAEFAPFDDVDSAELDVPGAPG